MTTPRKPRSGRHLAVAVCTALLAAGAAAQPHGKVFPSVDLGTVIEDKRGAQVPADLEFVDESGAAVSLGDYFTGERPIVLNLGYYGCPSLCGQVLNGLVEGLQGLTLELGTDYDIVTVSIDPSETPELARAKKTTYVAELGAPRAEQAWHFLTGNEPEIETLAGTVGFNYQWNEHGRQWDHSAAIMILSPTGTLAQVLQGAFYEPRTLRFALIEASEGKIGTTWDRILLTCYGYDPATREYDLAVWTVIRVGGGLTALVLAVMIFVLWRRERRRVAAATP